MSKTLNKKKKINVILCGFQWSGCRALEILLKNINIGKIYVYTHNTPYYFSNLEEFCIVNKINYTKEKISLKNLPFNPDLIISISYRYKIPSNVLKKTKYNGFNLHPSLLPYYKGCNSLMWAMINNERYVGYTYHFLSNNFDEGNIIYQKKIKTYDFELLIQLYYRVMFESLKKLNYVINFVTSGKNGVKQKIVKIKNYYPRKLPFEGIISSKWEEDYTKRFIKSLNFPPLKSASFNKIDIKDFKKYKKIINKK